jgi:hypothetical protein
MDKPDTSNWNFLTPEAKLAFLYTEQHKWDKHIEVTGDLDQWHGEYRFWRDDAEGMSHILKISKEGENSSTTVVELFSYSSHYSAKLAFDHTRVEFQIFLDRNYPTP